MSRNTQSVLMALLGALLISITVSGRFTSYVKPGFGPLLLIAGAVLIVVGVASVVVGLRADLRAHRAGVVRDTDPVVVNELSLHGAAANGADGAGPHDHAPDDAHGHSHDRSRAPWLVLAPILVLLLLAPPALGADAVSRNAGSQALAGAAGVAAPSGAGADVAAGGSSEGYAPNDGSGHAIGTKAFAKQRPTMQFPDLPVGKDPVLTLKDFVMRALYDADDSVSDNDVTVVGFIAPAGDGYADGYSLARLTISCCAADASPMRIHLTGTAKYPVNTWVTAVVSARTGTASSDNDYVPTADVTSMSPIAQPADPYEH
jgi:uncharacterized repeat protein (TIGR03943 family)